MCLKSSATAPDLGTSDFCLVSVLFSGSLRMNLDPTGEFTDNQLINVLKLSHMDKFVSASTGTSLEP